MPSTAKATKKPKWNYKVIIGVVVAALVLFLAYGYINAKNDIKRLSNPAAANKEERKEVLAKVSKLAELPQNEEPTLATVKDVTKLKGQAFFDRAKNGDKVLIYTDSKQAVLYRPSTNKVIESAPVNLGSSLK